jgi:hypothetical protein
MQQPSQLIALMPRWAACISAVLLAISSLWRSLAEPLPFPGTWTTDVELDLK